MRCISKGPFLTGGNMWEGLCQWVVLDVFDSNLLEGVTPDVGFIVTLGTSIDRPRACWRVSSMESIPIRPNRWQLTSA